MQFFVTLAVIGTVASAAIIRPTQITVEEADVIKHDVTSSSDKDPGQAIPSNRCVIHVDPLQPGPGQIIIVAPSQPGPGQIIVVRPDPDPCEGIGLDPSNPDQIIEVNPLEPSPDQIIEVDPSEPGNGQIIEEVPSELIPDLPDQIIGISSSEE